ncbi:MAG TPA: fibronectin type III domain-containing protein [Gammaproteobacteria bacterium]|nr:fibronectin type III domain-containing protein [Gammaproteobacteria bacterium]
MTTVVRESLLDGPALRLAGASPINPVGVNAEVKIDEGSITEDFSDLTTLKGERFLAASYLSYELNLYETVVRANSGVMLTSVVNESLMEKVPNAPTFLQVSGGNAQVSLTWRASTYDGGGTNIISGYVIQISTDSGTTWVTVIADTTSTTPYYVVPSLANGTSYQFRVAALNADGTGAYSSASQKVIPSA